MTLSKGDRYFDFSIAAGRPTSTHNQKMKAVIIVNTDSDKLDIGIKEAGSRDHA